MTRRAKLELTGTQGEILPRASAAAIEQVLQAPLSIVADGKADYCMVHSAAHGVSLIRSGAGPRSCSYHLSWSDPDRQAGDRSFPADERSQAIAAFLAAIRGPPTAPPRAPPRVYTVRWDFVAGARILRREEWDETNLSEIFGEDNAGVPVPGAADELAAAESVAQAHDLEARWLCVDGFYDRSAERTDPGWQPPAVRSGRRGRRQGRS